MATKTMAKATVEPPSEPAVNGVAKIECTFEEAVTRIGNENSSVTSEHGTEV